MEYFNWVKYASNDELWKFLEDVVDDFRYENSPPVVLDFLHDRFSEIQQEIDLRISKNEW